MPNILIKFESLNSQLISYNGDKIAMKGRDMYYGELWVSLNDKKIERLVMVEDVVGENQFDKNLFEMQRIVTFNKVTQVSHLFKQLKNLKKN